jgi:hypothetical protein
MKRFVRVEKPGGARFEAIVREAPRGYYIEFRYLVADTRKTASHAHKRRSASSGGFIAAKPADVSRFFRELSTFALRWMAEIPASEAVVSAAQEIESERIRMDAVRAFTK